MAGSRQETSRRDIIETARALFRQQGFDRTTSEDIAAWLGVSEQAVAAHFPSLDELLEAVWSE